MYNSCICSFTLAETSLNGTTFVCLKDIAFVYYEVKLARLDTFSKNEEETEIDKTSQKEYRYQRSECNDLRFMALMILRVQM